MFDLFGRKARAELKRTQDALNDLNLAYADSDQRIRELADIIREYDQGIFNMAQKTSWDAMRPIFNKLQAGQESRINAESNRINDILKRELIEVYRK